MLHPLVLYMPVELGLELVPSIGSDGIDPKRELLDHIINELDGALLVMLPVNLKRSDTGCVIDRRVLIAANLVSFVVFQRQELHIDLNMMPRNRFSISFGVQSPPWCCFGQPVKAVASQDTVDTRSDTEIP